MDRQTIQTQYNVTLTDNQWAILLQEVEGKESWESDDEVIDDVVTNISSYEEEYAWWSEQLAQGNSED